MVIVAGQVTVEPEQREPYLGGCVSIVERARWAEGCLDCAITADLIDPGRVNSFERGNRRQPSKPERHRMTASTDHATTDEIGSPTRSG